MKIIVNKVEQQDNNFIVSFTSEIRSAIGLWQSNVPKVGESYEVELDYDGDVIWNKNISFSNHNQTRISSKHGVEIIAKVESYQSGLLNLRLGNSLFTLEVQTDLSIDNKIVLRRVC